MNGSNRRPWINFNMVLNREENEGLEMFSESVQKLVNESHVRTLIQCARSLCAWSVVTFTFLVVTHSSVASSQDSIAPETPAYEVVLDDGMRLFEEKIRPLLIDNCLHCHGMEKQEGDLRLDHIDHLLKGGASGSVIQPNEPDESLIMEAVRYQSVEMPPDGPLTDQQIESLETWISLGAPWPEEVALESVRSTSEFTDSDRNHWSFQQVADPSVPQVTNRDWPKNEIDHFILRQLETSDLSPSSEADKRTLIRRLSFALIGLPPTAEQIEEFLADTSDNAYERLVRRYLEMPEFGERWAQHWLDLVRYADTDGYKADFERPNAWRYRDYVIRALNEDMPYDRFVMEQIAGDEVAPHDPNALIATGYLRHWIYEYNQRDANSQWQIILDDVTETTADVFLGLGFSCARCHDHKYDPILQRDYFRLQAFFNSIYPRDDLTVATIDEQTEYQTQLEAWEAATVEIRTRMAELEFAPLRNAKHRAVVKFPAEIQALYESEQSDRTTYENQIWHLVHLQVLDEQNKVDFTQKLRDEALEEWTALRDQLNEFDHLKPRSLPQLFGVTDWGTRPAETIIPSRDPGDIIEPGFMSILDPTDAMIEPRLDLDSTGRRTALASWLVDPSNPLTARVMVNRVWQQLFGVGIVSTSNDFGQLGSRPSHRELLDHLATRFFAQGWSIKELCFYIATSATYRQSSQRSIESSEQERAVDPDNRLLWRMNRQRLDAGQIRDALLFVSGELDLTRYGAAVDFDSPRRTVYLKVRRNHLDPFLTAFDFPDRITSLGQRSETTTPNQALEIINGQWVHERAVKVAMSQQSATTVPFSDERVAHKFELVFSRLPSVEEIALSRSFLIEQTNIAKQSMNEVDAAQAAWIDLCSALINANEFIFVD